MTAVWLDADTARRAAHLWTEQGERLHRRAVELEHELVALALTDHTGSWQHLTAAATSLWLGVERIRLVLTATEDRWLGPVGAAPAHRYSSAFGDPGGTGSWEVRTPYEVVGDTPLDRARALLTRALGDTADERRVRPDEFQLVRLDTGRFVVVLPGVVDLSTPDPGWHDHHRSVRDLDAAAFTSSRSTGLDGNRYARLVHASLVAAGVPTGAEILVVGHSFGADTALDLAADARFNGPTGYRVTHVVAAGYHSGPQLPAVPPATSVLVLQNRRDVPVIVEAIGAAHVTDAVVEQADALRHLVAGDPVAALRHQAASFGHQVGAVRTVGRHLAERADDAARVVVGAASRDVRATSESLTGLVTFEPGVRSPAPGQVVSVFDGGGAGFGHRQEHYVDHLSAVDDPAVVGFLESLDRAGYATEGTALAVDVSVP